MYYKLVPLVLIVVCVFGGFGERVRAADGFVFACADIRLHATAGICPLGLRDPFCFLPQRWIVCILESRQRKHVGLDYTLRTIPV